MQVSLSPGPSIHRTWSAGTHITLRIHPHLWHHVVVLHVLLADGAAVLDGFDPSSQIVRLDHALVDGGLGDERDGCAGERGLEIIST